MRKGVNITKSVRLNMSFTMVNRANRTHTLNIIFFFYFAGLITSLAIARITFG